MSVHSWCRDIPRDEAVRAAEDGRDWPLPTLAEAIWAARAMMPKSVSGSSAPEQENKGNGMRTERITLEVTHDLDAPLGDWIVQVIDESLGFDEYVRVVEECCLDRINMGEVIRERDAAIREREKAEQRADRDFVKCSALADKVIELRARVAELESALAARGWLTEDERRLIEIAVKSQRDPYDITGTSQHNARVLRNLLARSTPPEVEGNG